MWAARLGTPVRKQQWRRVSGKAAQNLAAVVCHG
jgi:hypothetical protein